MKRTGLLLLIGLFAYTKGQTQANFTFDEDNVMVWVDPSKEGSDFGKNIAINTELDTLELSWKVIDVDLPAEWEYVVCDNANCYLGEDLENETVKKSHGISAAFPGLVKGSVYPKGIFGTGSIKVVFMEDGNSARSDTIVFLFDGTLSSYNPVYTSVTLYPNPAQNELHVQFNHQSGPVTQLSVYNILGAVQTIESSTFIKETTLDIASLQTGVYFVRAQMPDGTTLVGKFEKRR